MKLFKIFNKHIQKSKEMKVKENNKFNNNTDKN